MYPDLDSGYADLTEALTSKPDDEVIARELACFLDTLADELDIAGDELDRPVLGGNKLHQLAEAMRDSIKRVRAIRLS